MKLETLAYILHELWEHFLLIPWFLLLTLRYSLYYFNNNSVIGRFISTTSRYFFKDVKYGKEERNVMDIFPAKSVKIEDGKHRVLLFIHGGGWASGRLIICHTQNTNRIGNKHIYHYLGKR